jgi:hypothetical protein
VVVFQIAIALGAVAGFTSSASGSISRQTDRSVVRWWFTGQVLQPG